MKNTEFLESLNIKGLESETSEPPKLLKLQ